MRKKVKQAAAEATPSSLMSADLPAQAAGFGNDRSRDLAEIRDVCTRLHWFVDHKQWHCLDQVLADEVSLPTLAEQNQADFDPQSVIRSRADIIAGYPNLLDGLITSHLIVGHHIEIDGDQAVCTAHSLNGHAALGALSAPPVWHGNEYQFDLRRTPDGWRICGRRTWIRWSHGEDRHHDVGAKQDAWTQRVPLIVDRRG